jgi:hypothetical protein
VRNKNLLSHNFFFTPVVGAATAQGSKNTNNGVNHQQTNVGGDANISKRFVPLMNMPP